jgi:hypothetical protein
MSSATTESLRIVNGNLRAGLARLQPEPNASCLLKTEDLSDLHAVVLCAARCRRSLASDGVPDGELEKEICEYRSNIEKLAKVLLSVQGRLLAEKARLQNAQSHVAATNAWAQASKDTL